MRRHIRIAQLANSIIGKGDEKKRCAGVVPVSPATIWRWVKLGEFPAPVKLGAQTTAWPVEAVDEWLAARSMGNLAVAKN